MRLALALAATLAGAAVMPAGAAAHSLVRVNGSELAYTSADATSLNTLTVRPSGDEIVLRDPSVDGGIDPGPCRPGAVTPDANAYITEAVCGRAGLTRVRVDLGEREDSATIDVPLPVTLLGGPGADRLTAGPAADTVAGGEGNDRLSGAAGADALDGGAGVDVLDGGEGDDRLNSADGLGETVSCGTGADNVQADAADEVAGDCESVVRSAVVPPPDAESTGADTTAPIVRAGASTLQRLTRSGRVRIAATSSERGFLSASGFLQTKGLNLPISSDRRRVSVAGGGALLTVTLRGRSLREARRALARKRGVSVRVGVVATDAAGNSADVRAPRIRLGGLARATRAAVKHPEPGDRDGDGVRDESDNCPDARNGDQRNTDGLPDGGDACDRDMDQDGFFNDGSAPADNCPPIANPDQSSNPCTEDQDADGVATYQDNCFDVFNPDQRNNDLRYPYGDATGDACDPDDDGDGVFDDRDNCPLSENPDQTDADGDGRGYLCDADDTPPATITGTPGAGGGPATGPPDSTPPKVTVLVARRLRFATVEDGLVVRLRCSEACTANVRLHAARRLARRLRLPRDRIAAAGSAHVEQAASTYAFVRFPRAVERRAWRLRQLHLTLRVEVVDRAGNRGTAVRSVTLVR